MSLTQSTPEPVDTIQIGARISRTLDREIERICFESETSKREFIERALAAEVARRSEAAA